MPAVMRPTLYLEGTPNEETRVHIVCEDGTEFDIMSDCPHYTSTRWKIDVNSAQTDLQQQIESINNRFKSKAANVDAPEGIAWVKTNISEGDTIIVDVRSRHGSWRGTITLPTVTRIHIEV